VRRALRKSARASSDAAQAMARAWIPGVSGRTVIARKPVAHCAPILSVIPWRTHDSASVLPSAGETSSSSSRSRISGRSRIGTPSSARPRKTPAMASSRSWDLAMRAWTGRSRFIWSRASDRRAVFTSRAALRCRVQLSVKRRYSCGLTPEIPRSAKLSAASEGMSGQM